jgi:hypothetical protein
VVVKIPESKMNSEIGKKFNQRSFLVRKAKFFPESMPCHDDTFCELAGEGRNLLCVHPQFREGAQAPFVGGENGLNPLEPGLIILA